VKLKVLDFLPAKKAELSIRTAITSIVAYAMHKIKKENPIDALKNENI
jgi:hypothetical protein